MIDHEFIQRAQNLLVKEVEEAHENKKLHRRMIYEENWDRYRGYEKKYAQTEKGKIARNEQSRRRYERFKAACADLNEEEYYQIEQFYEDCPPGYHVDHIISLAMGGLHRLSNLQYLPARVNAKKATKESWEPDDYTKIEFKGIRKDFIHRKKR